MPSTPLVCPPCGVCCTHYTATTKNCPCAINNPLAFLPPRGFFAATVVASYVHSDGGLVTDAYSVCATVAFSGDAFIKEHTRHLLPDSNTVAVKITAVQVGFFATELNWLLFRDIYIVY